MAPWLTALAVATVLLGAVAALAQKDLKRILAYSSVNHLGYCVLAVAAVAACQADRAACASAVSGSGAAGVQPRGHRRGAVFRDRHSGSPQRRRARLERFRRTARATCRCSAGLMGMALFASLGLPGLSGFVGEFLIFNGVFGLVPWSAAISVIGLLLTAVFLLRLIRKVFHGPLHAGPGEMAGSNDRRTLVVRAGHRPDRHSRLVAAGAAAIHQCRHASLARTSPPDPMTPAWTILSAFAGALLVLLLPARMAMASRVIALVASLIGAVAAAAACLARLQRSRPRRSGRSTGRGLPSLGIRFHLAADGLSLTLLLLTGLVAIAGVLFSWNVEQRPRAFFAFFLTIIGGVYGVFLSRDAFLLFVCYEIVILPKYMLIAIWGSTNKEYGAMKLTMYSIGVERADPDRPGGCLCGGGRHQFRYRPSGRRALFAGAAGVGVPDLVPGLRGAGGHLAVPHLGADRPRGGAHRGLDVAGGRGDETRCLRRAVRGDAVVSAGLRAMETGDRRPGGDRHRLWRAHRAGAEGSQVRDRLFQRQPHGLCVVRSGGGHPLGPARRGAANDLPRHHRGAALRYRRARGL